MGYNYYQRICSVKNLNLAWNRITTGQNHYHKKYFRALYYSYQPGLDQNLRDLNERLLTGSYNPKKSERIYYPKTSGLQRPITLLHIEDQILFQALANIAADKCEPKRAPFIYKNIFSSVLNKNDEKFFYNSWQNSYSKFQKAIKYNYNSGLKWVAHFDLAAFFDTISHELLIRSIFPRVKGELKTILLEWLKVWGSETISWEKGHGIPQGPIASNYLAECFFVPIDEELSDGPHYLRYVDDIRLFGKSELDVRRKVLKLEMACLNRGLIPQGKKFAIKKLTSVKDALGALPSIPESEYNEEIKLTSLYTKDKAVYDLRKVLVGRPQTISDSSKAKHIFFHSPESEILLGYALRLLPRHPELTDAFVAYLSKYGRRKPIINTALNMIRGSPHEYVQGEMWHILARMLKPEEMHPLLETAINISKGNYTVVLKWGTLHFLCIVENYGLGKYSKFITWQSSSFLQSLIVPVLPEENYFDKQLIKRLLKRTNFEPGLVLSSKFVENKISLHTLDVKIENLPSQIINVFNGIGLIEDSKIIDPIGEIIEKRLGLKSIINWKYFLDNNYFNACQIFRKGDSLYYIGRSEWLSYQNSFNHLIIMNLQKLLHKKDLKGKTKFINKKGEKIPYGRILDSKVFKEEFPILTAVFKEIQDRRSTLPGTHPFEIKGDKNAKFLGRNERNRFSHDLRFAFNELILFFEKTL